MSLVKASYAFQDALDLSRLGGIVPERSWHPPQHIAALSSLTFVAMRSRRSRTMSSDTAFT
eukprot:8006955-Heterocapsa_arctica.AAC.1